MNDVSKKIREAINTRNVRDFLAGLKESSQGEIEKIDDRTGMNIVHFCVKEKALKELTLILGQYPQVNLEVTTYGLSHQTALDLALSWGYVRMCKILIDNGALITIKDIKLARKKFKNDEVFVAYMDSLLKEYEKRHGFLSFLKISKKNPLE